MDTSCHAHRRFNPLKNEWVIVAPQRVQRPWAGQMEAGSRMDEQDDVNNPLLPGAVRASGQLNPEYQQVYCFENDFPALDKSKMDTIVPEDPLFRSQPACGSCHVLCYHRCSQKHFANMTDEEVSNVIRCWIKQTKELSGQNDWVQIFENRGAAVGCSNSHPHGQIWACQFLPTIPEQMDRCQMDYKQSTARVMLIDYAEQEMERQERVVFATHLWVVVVPFWAVWPYETMILPRRHVLRLTDLSEEEQNNFAHVLKHLLFIYDHLFETPFPYSMGWYGAPTGRYSNNDMSHWQLHMVFLPPLLRSASVKKFMAGFELLCEPQRDLTPESAAERLRSVHCNLSAN